MRLFRLSAPRQFRLLMLVMASLLFAPFASFGAMAVLPMDASDKVCETGQTAQPMAQMASDCCDQATTDCQTHCLDLMLSHVPVSAVPAFGSFPFPAVAQTVRQTTRHMSGISSLPDPRPPRI